MALKISVDQTFAQLLHCSLRLISLEAVNAPSCVTTGEHQLLAKRVSALRVLSGIEAQEQLNTILSNIKHACPCFYCGYHQPKSDGVFDETNPDTYEFKCTKNKSLTDESMFEYSTFGCTEYNPEGALLGRGDIPDDVEKAKSRYSTQSVAQAFRIIGQAMVDAANKELGV